MKTLATLTAPPGETAWLDENFDRTIAEKIAGHFYDNVTRLERTESGGKWAVKTSGGYVAIIGTFHHPTLGNLPAILHKTIPLRTIDFLAL